MTNASGETKISSTGFMNIIDMLPYRVEQLFRKSLRDSAKQYETEIYYFFLEKTSSDF